MAEGAEVLDDGKRWRITLRPGLRFHDGEPVRARDCIASLKRWCAREPFGQLLIRQVDEWRAVDDRTIEIRLKRAFPLLLDALAKPDSSVPFIMPERLAETDPNRGVTEMIGSGPYRFISGALNGISCQTRRPQRRPCRMVRLIGGKGRIRICSRYWPARAMCAVKCLTRVAGLPCCV
jgi:ABC-type oligopeptide transport system substrate-binding subunit